MTASPLSLLSLPPRTLEWLVGPDALLSSTALSTGQLASLGPIASLVEGTVDGSSGDNGGSLLPDSLTDTANQIILGAHAQLEEVGHEVTPLNRPLHGLTNLGETIGLGHIGEAGNLITDVSGAVANPTGAVAPTLTDAGHVTDAAGVLLDTVTAVPAAGNGLVGSGSVLTPATEILNQAVLDVHTTLEDVGHQISALNPPIHALTGLGETVGLGHIGEAGNLLTDTLALPGSILNGGGLASAEPVLADLGRDLGAADTLITSVTGVANADGLLSSNGLLAPVATLANTAVLDLHATLENFGHEIPLLNDAIHGLTNLGETAGLGHLGQTGNLLTDVAALPGDLLGGQGLGAVSPVLGDAGAATTAAGGLLDGVTGIVGGLGDGGTGGSAAGGLLTPITAAVDSLLGGHSADPLGTLLGGIAGEGLDGTGALLGTGAPLQPVANVANTLIDGVHATLEQVGHEAPLLSDPLHTVISLGNTIGFGALGDTSNLLTDTINLPGAILTGNASGAVAQVVNDVGHVADALGGVAGSVSGILDTAGGETGLGMQGDGILAPVASALDGVLGGSNAGSGSGVTGALLGTNAPLQPVTDVVNTAGSGQFGEASNLLTDVGNLPGAALSGNGSPAVAQVASDVGHLADAGGVLGSVSGILPEAGADGHGAGTSLDGVLSPVTTALSAADAGAGNPVGDLLSGLAGGTTGDAGAGTHPLIDVAAGPTTATPVADVAVLTPPADPAHVVQASAIAVPADQPSLVTASLLSGDGIVLPQTSGGADQLVGQVLSSTPAATPTGEAGTSHDLHVDLGIAAIDLGGHTDVHHTDPTPHTATSGLHLLGL